MGRKRYKVGDRVSWLDASGRLVAGRVVKVALSPGHLPGGPFEATKKDPGVIVRRDDDGRRVARQASAWRALEAERGRLARSSGGGRTEGNG